MRQEEKIVTVAVANSIIQRAGAKQIADGLFQTPNVTIRLSTLADGRVKMTLTERRCDC
jgi:hypothetical protein